MRGSMQSLLTAIFHAALVLVTCIATAQASTCVSGDHECFIKMCYELALETSSAGNHPFGAVLVYEGRVLLTSKNTVETDNDVSHHAELNLLVEAARTLSKEIVRDSILYSSVYPCIGCCNVALYRGISKIVYGVSLEKFIRIFGQNKTGLTCKMLYESLDRPVDMVGPVLEDEGMQVLSHWPESDNLYPFVKIHFAKHALFNKDLGN